MSSLSVSVRHRPLSLREIVRDRAGLLVLWPLLPAAGDRAQDDFGANPEDDQIEDHLPGDQQPGHSGDDLGRVLPKATRPMSQQWADRVPCRRLRLQDRLRRARRHTMSGTARPAAAK